MSDVIRRETHANDFQPGPIAEIEHHRGWLAREKGSDHGADNDQHRQARN
jgi:hypothetical protein